MLSLRMLLPDDLIVQTLSWVPVKSLMRFRCVSKSWNSLVLDSNFVTLHLERSRRDTQLLFRLDNADGSRVFLHHCSLERLLDDPLSTIYAAGLEFGITYNILGVCNGLVCLTARSCVRHEDFVQFWNPATRLRSETFSYLYPCFDTVMLGFGYDDSCDTYKVVLFAMDWKSREMELKVYTLEDNSGRKVVTCSAFPYQPVGNGMFLSGTLNWPVRQSTTREVRIFSFDMREETYRYFSTPDDLQIGEGFPSIEVLRDCLYVSYTYDNTPFVIWQMKEFGVQESWTLLIKVGKEHLSFDPYDYPYSMVTNSDVVLFSWKYSDPPKIVFYNRRDNKVDHIETPGKIFEWGSNDYVESLVLPYRI